MELKLAKDEELIKSWEYACSFVETKNSKVDENNITRCNIALSNKRCVLQREKGLNIERREVFLKDVCGITTERKVETSSSKKTIGRIIGGILLILVGAFLLFGLLSSMIDVEIPMWIRFVGGILLIIIGIWLCSKGKEESMTAFAINIYTRSISCDIISDAVGFGFLYDVKKKEKSDDGIITLIVDRTIVNDILENIGALIIENS